MTHRAVSRPPCAPFLALGSALLCASAPALARADGDDPYRYALRSALFPLAFSAGVSQSSFGAALRADADLGRRVTLAVSGLLPFAPVIGRDEGGAFRLDAGLSLHVYDAVSLERLEGTVHPKDAASPSGRGSVGSDSDLAVPVSTRLGGPELRAPEHVGGDAEAPIRGTHSVRVGYQLARSIQRARPVSVLDRDRYAQNTVHALYLGYGFGHAWNLSPATAGDRELGFRRFYLDALLTLDPLVDEELLTPPAPQPGDTRPTLFALGLRLGMQGAIDALIRDADGLGFAYAVELSALPGRSGLEGQLLIALGIELDVATAP